MKYVVIRQTIWGVEPQSVRGTSVIQDAIQNAGERALLPPRVA